MHKHEPENHKPEQPDASKGYEVSDVRVSGIVIFLVALTIFAVVTGLLAYGVGKVLDARMKTEDGPPSRWARPVDVRPLGNMPSNPEMENKMGELAERFPTPRLQTDDGSQDVADLHRREDLLLEHYSWADQQQGKVRIPIERAMEIVAQGNTIQVLPPKQLAEPMTGEKNPVVTAPLTTGFARTSFEQAQAAKGSN